MSTLAIIASTLLLGAAGPETGGMMEASCRLIALGDDILHDGPDSLRAECPSVAGLQEAADQALAAMDMNVRPVRFQTVAVARSIHFGRNNGRWTPLPGQRVIWTELLFPVRAIEYGAQHMLCALAISPDATGRPRDVEAECLSDVRSQQSRLARSARRAADDWRYLPVALEYCLDEQIHESMQVNVQRIGQTRTFNPGPMPNPADLPNLCAAD